MPEFIAHYRVGTKLGQGAMGEVYRATDTKLGRDVAIKLIAPSLAADEARLASFAREAQVLASLNHPNIAAIYGVEDRALVMELVEGPTLADRIKQGPMPLDEALPIARQIAEGLAAAHDRGIVHRDLKPANIKITPGGVVKLLDFGLAKAAAVAAASPDDAATVAFSMVGAEQIVGTPAYMAPEQARGLPLDRRADIWAFGVVFYEMLTGTTLFKGETLTDVMAAVVREEPDLTKVPAAVRPVLRRCLEKDPRRRLRDVGDAFLLLESASDTPVAETRAPAVRAWLPWVAAAVAALAFAAVLAVHLRETPPVASTVRFKITLPSELTFTQTTPFALSPNGRVLAFPAVSSDGATRIWLQQFDKTAPQPLTSSEVAANPEVLFWSPDSTSIVFSHDQKLKRIDIEGGPPITLGDLPRPMIGFAMNRDGVMVYGTSEGIVRLDAPGGKPAPLTTLPAQTLQAPMQFLPDGRQFLYTTSGPAGRRGIHVASIDRAPADQKTEPILLSDFGASLIPPVGSLDKPQLLTVRDSTLEAQDFDPDNATVLSEPRAIADNVFVVNTNAFGLAFYSVSDEGALVYRTGTTAEGLSRQLAWVGRDGRMQTIFTELGRYNQVKVSPDATRVVSSRSDLGSGAADLWITDLESETSSKFTFGGGINAQPVWSADGKNIAWARVAKTLSLLRKAADGSTGEQLLYTFPEDRPGNVAINVSDWSHDGRFLIYSYVGDVYALPVDGSTAADRQPIPIAATPDVREFGASVSPDGRWIAYISNETSRQELYVQPFAPGVAAAPGTTGGGKWLVSRTGTMGLARWRSDSRELMFLNADGALTTVSVAAAPAFKTGAPQVLAALPRSFLVQAGNPGALADASRDLQRLLLAIPSEASRRQELSVVLNWPSAVRR